jgi:hypothetical protein
LKVALLYRLELIFFLIFFSYLLLSKSCLAYFWSPTPTTEFTTEIILSEELNENLSYPGLGIDFYVVSDEDENFYLPSFKGYTKYNSTGTKVYSVKHDASGNNISNLVYTNGKIIFLCKDRPGTVYIFNADTGDLLSENALFPDSVRSLGVFDVFSFSDLTLDQTGNYIFFASFKPVQMFKFSIASNDFDFYKIPSDNPLAFYSPPVLVDTNKVLFTPRSGSLILFDNNNFSNFLFAESFSYENYFLRQASAGYTPASYNDTNFFMRYWKYICTFEKVGGYNKKCEHVGKNGVSILNTNIVSDSLGLYFLIKIRESSSSTNYVTRYTNSLDPAWQKAVPNAAKGGVFKDFNGNILVSSSTIYKIQNETGQVLGTADLLEEDEGFYRVTLPSPTAKGNYYIFVTKYKNNRKIPYIYKFKGKEAKVENCEIGFYCTSTPKHKPVILIHGLGGNYQSWFDGKNQIVRERILQEYQSKDPEYPNHWVHSYSYGYDFDGDYNYQGKIEDISTNLHFDVDRLAKEYKQAGGK